MSETLNQWKQRAHLITLLNPPVSIYSELNLDGVEAFEREDFVERFCDGELELGSFERGLERTWQRKEKLA